MAHDTTRHGPLRAAPGRQPDDKLVFVSRDVSEARGVFHSV